MSFNNQRIQMCLSALVASVMVSACGGGSGTPAATSTAEVSSADPVNASPVARASAAAVTALTVTGQPPTSVPVGSAYYFNANTTGGNGNTVTFGIQNRPSWATLNTNTGELKGTPSAAGTFSNIIISATDGQSTAKLAAFSIVVGGTTTSSPLSVTVSWAAPGSNTDGTTFDNPAGFVIHYGTSSSNLNKSVTIGSYAARSYKLTGLSKGSTYYFAVAAINTLNMEGERSAITSIAL